MASATGMLQSGGFDLVVVASPPAPHVEHATAALEHGAAVDPQDAVRTTEILKEAWRLA